MGEGIISMLVVVLCSIMLDWVISVFISIKNKEFSVNKLPQTLITNVFPYIGSLLVVALVAIYVPYFEYVFTAYAGLVILKFSKEALIDKVKLILK